MMDMLTRIRSLNRNTLGIIALILTVLFAFLFRVAVNVYMFPPAVHFLAVPPYSFKRYYVHYDVKGDGTYSEVNEVVMNVDTEEGIQLSKRFYVKMPSMVFDFSKIDVEVLTAYTLKKNGQHVEAIWSDHHDEELANAGNVMQSATYAPLKMIEFKDAIVGDALVFSYKVVQKEAVSPGNVAISQVVSGYEKYDDVVVNLSAPATLNLQADTDGFETVKATNTAGIQNWVWKYQNRKADVFRAVKAWVVQAVRGVPSDMMARIHISTFKDTAAEWAALRPKSLAPKVQTAEAAPLILEGSTPEERFASEKKAAEAGNAEAQMLLAYAYDVGIGVTKDAAKAIEWYEKSAAQGYPRAQLMLGQDYFFGKWGKREIAKGAEWYQKAVSQAGIKGDPSVESRIGLAFEKGKEVPKDAAKAMEWYQRAAAQDYGLAQFYLSLMYENGNGVPKDAAKAEEWFQKAVAHGWEEDKDDLNKYTTLSPDRDKSVAWFKKGAERGYASAQYRLGEIYESWMHEIYGYGSGVANDYDKAFDLYQKAAEQGHVKAQYSLGEMYRHGKGVAADADKAIEWYQKAAAHADAQMQKTIKGAIKETYAQGEVGSAPNGSSPNSDIRLITATRIGPVKLGMRLGEAKNALPATAKFARTENAEGLALIAVRLGDEVLMILYAGEEHEDSPIEWSKRIENIETFDPECHTAEGVHPYSLVRDVEKVYGKTKQIMVSEIESREFIDFKNQPKHFLIRSDYIGIFPTDSARYTTKFKPDGEILSIAISSN
jgi:TPR repeat protein